MHQTRDVQRLTHLFPIFLGLRLVPAGLWFLAVGFASALGSRVPTGFQALLAIVAVAAIWPIHGWYRREYGVVEPERMGLGRSWTLVAGLAMALVALALGAHRLGGAGGQVLLLVLVFFLTAVLYAAPRAFGGGSRVGVVTAAAIVVGAALLLAAGRDPLRFNHLGSLFSLAVGGSLCLAGVIEHRLLARAFQRPREGDDG